ncbi:MAG: 8-amino-7-oxononanoate synthase [Gammaproteobacteria bacterium]|nr:8-amino-7-oxononanoate synthase [Gammaproteobacteria bacterium]
MDIETELVRLKTDHLYRRRQVITSPQATVVQLNGRAMLSFCSNDYLGLANHPSLVKALQKGASRYGVGSGSAHLVSGHFKPHHDLELRLAELTQRPRALLFSTGYMANLGVLSAFAQRGQILLEDRLNHASLIDGARITGARLTRYSHNDVAAVASHLSKQSSHSGDKRCLVATDTIFSMDGDIAPLRALAKLSQKHQALFMVDDAHGFGLRGQQGAGTLSELNLSYDEVPLLMGTLGKACGTFGAFVAGSETLIETLIQRARTYIYTTALPPAVAYATLTSLNLLRDEAWRRSQLDENIAYFRACASQLKIAIGDSLTPIQPLIVGASIKALEISQKLQQQGILITAIRPPTVAKGSARLRITLCTEHSREDIDRLFDTLAPLL